MTMLASIEDARNAAEKAVIIDHLRAAQDNISKAARTLMVSRMTLYRLLEKHGIDRNAISARTHIYTLEEGQIDQPFTGCTKDSLLPRIDELWEYQIISPEPPVFIAKITDLSPRTIELLDSDGPVRYQLPSIKLIRRVEDEA